MTVKSVLIRNLENVREEFRSLLNAADPELEISPGWTVKEVLAHITGWDLVTVQAIQSYQKRSLYLLDTMDIDACNREIIKSRQDHTLKEVFTEWEQARRSLVEAVQALDEEDLEDGLMYPWGEEGSLQEMLEIIAGHEKEHAREIQRLES
jgi:hypothetical protein